MAFTVYKSSAGSGKTYTLVREYLKLVLINPANFRHVLAVTFTNKAANEMKERIVKVLKGISSLDDGEVSGSVKGLACELMDLTNLSKEKLVKNSSQVLSLILHNYSEFAVSTIDSFMHRIIRSFAFDLNVPVNFEVELDTEEVLKQVIDVLISRVGVDKQLTSFLVDFVMNRTEEEKNWNIEKDLLGIAHLLKKEDSHEYLDLNKHLELKDYVKINSTLYREIVRFEDEIKRLGKHGLDIISSSGIPVSSFYMGERGIVSYLKALAAMNSARLTPSKTMEKAMAENRWFSAKATKQDQQDIILIQDDLSSVYEKVQVLVYQNYENYVLFTEIRKTLYPLAILDKVNAILEEFKSENNILLIAEFNQLIAEIVLDEPVPFIYERVGEKYKHFLIDEFQDTSVLQWQNLLPLMENSLSKAFENLVVGDAKQAIYRWRNGEVEQFERLPEVYRRPQGQIHLERENALRLNYQQRSLNSNYRSKKGIVEFNNNFFKYISKYLAEEDRSIYREVDQQVVLPGDDGFIQFEFYDKGEESRSFEEFNVQHILSIIKDLLLNGYSYEDVAILCRTNREGGMIANHLLDNKIPVVSNESVLLNSSPKVKLIISMLQLTVNPTDQIAAVQLLKQLLDLGLLKTEFHVAASDLFERKFEEKGSFEGVQVFELLSKYGYPCSRSHLLSFSLFDLCENLVRLFHFHDQEDPFIQFFLDVVIERENESASDIANFLEYWKKKSGKLSIVVPEGVNAIRIMTIHKAKGLEFPVVIYPMVKESVKKAFDSVWIEPELEMIPELKAAFVRAGKAFEGTRFGDIVNRELQKSLLDMINLLYVTFTRPTDHLYMIASSPSASKTGNVSVSSLIVDYLKYMDVYQDDVNSYQFGNVTRKDRSSEKELSPFPLENIVSENWRSRAQLSYQSPVNWEVEAPQMKQEWGNVVHEILAQIKTADTLFFVLDDFLYRGIINEQEKKLLQELIKEFLDRPSVSVYFKEGLEVLTETEIISPVGKLLRPDRIVRDGDQVFVIDFKTGGVRPSHEDQMMGYLQVMKEMEWAETKGVLLYLNHVEPVVFQV